MNFPILSAIIFIPLIGALFILVTKEEQKAVVKNSKYVAIFSSLANFFLSIFLWYSFDTSTSEFQFVEEKNWMEGFINFQLGIDGISILFILLTTFIAPICIFSGIHSIKFKIKEFLIAILVMETLMLGVFCSLDLVVFYLFFEGGLIPMFLIIGIWGGPKRVYSAFKFFLFTLLGSVLMLIAIISIYWITGTTDVIKLLDMRIPQEYQYLLWLAFFSSFAVKLPMWPFHTWLPDAHVEAPTAGSVILAAILLKMAGYGFMRFSLGLFPVASDYFTPLIFTLSVIAIIYTSLVALMQDDMKKLIAYSSVAHMGFVTIGIFSLTKQGLEGSIIQMMSHGLISAALFLCVGVVYDRLHSRMISSYGGLVNIMPKYAFVFMIFVLAALGLPGTSGFVGEFLVLVGTFQVSIFVSGIQWLISNGIIILETEANNQDEEGRFAGGILTGQKCDTNIDKDGDKVPDNLDVEGPIDWSNCNLFGLNLSNLKLSGADLSYSSLYASDISNTDLSGANLSHATIYKANIANTNFTYADLSYANLCGAAYDENNTDELPGVGTVYFDFTGANLSHADLDHSFLMNADLTDTLVMYTNFNDADLFRVDLSGKDLTGTILTEADLTQANLAGVDLSGKDFGLSTMSGKEKIGTIFTGANLSDTNLTGTDLSGKDLTGTILTGADLSNANLTGIDLSGKDLTGTILTGADLSDTLLLDANLTGANLQNADLKRALLVDANLSNVILTGADLSQAILTGTILTGANLENAILTNTILNCIGHSICI